MNPNPAPHPTASGVPRPSTVALVEDDALIRSGWTKILERMAGFCCCGEYASGEEALAEIPKQPPDFVLMDIRLPGMSGIECTRALKDRLPNLEVIMLTMFDDSDLVFEALRAGASGYLLKRSTPAALRQALEQVRAGGAPTSPEIARQIFQYFHRQPQPAPAKQTTDEMDKLSARETAILQRLAEGRPYKEIAAMLEISMQTVQTYIKRIYQKLHVHSRTDAVVKYLGSERAARKQERG